MLSPSLYLVCLYCLVTPTLIPVLKASSHVRSFSHPVLYSPFPSPPQTGLNVCPYSTNIFSITTLEIKINCIFPPVCPTSSALSLVNTQESPLLRSRTCVCLVLCLWNKVGPQ